uniref:Uncharacterized protein n=1 Tax=Cacopsylla melanoneura TaxID=428564 RepID=A0A8D8VHZ6_9HEMI
MGKRKARLCVKRHLLDKKKLLIICIVRIEERKEKRYHLLGVRKFLPRLYNIHYNIFVDNDGMCQCLFFLLYLLWVYAKEPPNIRTPRNFQGKRISSVDLRLS